MAAVVRDDDVARGLEGRDHADGVRLLADARMGGPVELARWNSSSSVSSNRRISAIRSYRARSSVPARAGAVSACSCLPITAGGYR